MKQLTLNYLKNKAVLILKWRGHSFKWDKPFRHWKGWGINGTCRYCGCELQLLTHHAPNETQISGSACAQHCKKEKTQ